MGKTDVRYWAERIFHRRRDGVGDTHWTAQVQFLRRREQFPLGTPNKAAAAAKARDIYLSLQARGWEETLALHKPKPEEPKPERSTVGDLIREVAATTHCRVTTFAVYCGALRRIASDIAKIPEDKSRFGPNGAGNKEWRTKVDSTPLELLTPEAIQQWKLNYLSRQKESPAKHNHAINTVNAHIRNARSLFSPKALEFAGKRLALPDPYLSAAPNLKDGAEQPGTPAGSTQAPCLSRRKPNSLRLRHGRSNSKSSVLPFYVVCESARSIPCFGNRSI